MPQLVTDPEILRQLNAPDPTPAAPGTAPYGAPAPTPAATPDAAPAPSQDSPAAFQAPPAGMTRVTDPAILAQLNAPDDAAAPPEHLPPGVRFRTDGSPVDVVNKPTAKADPIYHGAVPIGEAPDMGATTAFASGVQGAPIVGPAISSGIQSAAAAGRSLVNGTSYEDERRNVGEMTDLARQQHPTAAFAGDMTGAVTATAPLVEMAPAAFGAGRGGLTLGKVAAGTTSGGVIGAGDAAVRSGGDPDAIRTGAIAGGVAGAAGPILGAIASQAGRGVASLVGYFGNRGTGLSAPVRQSITRAAEADGALGPEGLARIREAGPYGMLADIGPATAGVLDTAVQRGGPGATAARQAVESRAAASSRDLSTALDEALGPEQGLHTAETAIRTGSAPARSAAYGRAYESPIDYASAPGRDLEAIVRNHVPANAIAQANALIRADPEAGISRQILAHVGDDGRATFERLPDVRQLDLITRGLGDIAAAENGKGKLGGTTQLGNVYGNLAKMIRAKLRQAVPAYAEALETAAEPIAARNALQFGSKLLRTTVPRDVAVETISHMTGPELQQARAGVRTAFGELMASVQRTATDGNTDAREALAAVKAFSSRAAQEKMALLLGGDEAAARARGLDEAVTRAIRAQELRGAVATNSRTAGRQMADEAVKTATERPVLDAVVGLKPQQFGGSILGHIFGRSPAAIGRNQDAVYGDLASTLTGLQGRQAESVLERLIRGHGIASRAQSVAGAVPFDSLSSTGLLALLPPVNQGAQQVRP